MLSTPFFFFFFFFFFFKLSSFIWEGGRQIPAAGREKIRTSSLRVWRLDSDGLVPEASCAGHGAGDWGSLPIASQVVTDRGLPGLRLHPDVVIMKNRSFNERFLFALNGLGAAWQRETSFRVQAVLAACAVVVLVVLRPPLVWWAIVAIDRAVLVIELVNSAFEALVDHLHPDAHPKVRIIKDMAAGSVLLSAAGAVVVGLLLLVNYYWD